MNKRQKKKQKTMKRNQERKQLRKFIVTIKRLSKKLDYGAPSEPVVDEMKKALRTLVDNTCPNGFQSIEEMFKYIENESYSLVLGIHLYKAEDLSIGESLGKDDRIDWRETRYVLSKRCGMTIYITSQCIGMCSIEEE